MTALSLPTEEGRADPIYKAATQPPSDSTKTAAFIFIHGLADSAEFIQNVADQFQGGNKLPYMSWILPNAKYNRHTMDTAWYLVESLPALKPPRPELAPTEDEEGMLETIAYLEMVVDAVHRSGIPLNRIVIGGFSQGNAMSFLLHIISPRFSGKLAGIAGLLGYLPLCDEKPRLHELRAERGLPPQMDGRTPMFFARGMKDPLVRKRPFQYSLENLKALGVDESLIETHEYEGLTHTLHGPVLRDLCVWLEKTVPPLE